MIVVGLASCSTCAWAVAVTVSSSFTLVSSHQDRYL